MMMPVWPWTSPVVLTLWVRRQFPACFQRNSFRHRFRWNNSRRSPLDRLQRLGTWRGPPCGCTGLGEDGNGSWSWLAQRTHSLGRVQFRGDFPYSKGPSFIQSMITHNPRSTRQFRLLNSPRWTIRMWSARSLPTWLRCWVSTVDARSWWRGRWIWLQLTDNVASRRNPWDIRFCRCSIPRMAQQRCFSRLPCPLDPGQR